MRNVLLAAALLVPVASHAKKPKATPGTDLPAHAVSTAPLTLALVTERFAELDAKIVTLKSGFRQFVRLDGSDTVQTVEGEVLFRKPDLIRLTHRIPEPQTVVSDGTWLWVHRRSTNQVIQTKLADWRRSEPLAKGLLDFGKTAELLRVYDAAISTVSAPRADGHRSFVVTLKPKPADRKDAADAFELTLTADDKDFFPYEARLRVGHASIRSIFENVRLNPEFPDETFRFSPPKDADVFQSPTLHP